MKGGATDALHQLAEFRMGSFNEKIGFRGTGSEANKVPTITLDVVVREYGVPCNMKIDIEGHDAIVPESPKKLEAIPPTALM